MRYPLFDQPGKLSFEAENAENIVLDLRELSEDVRDQTFFLTLQCTTPPEGVDVQVINIVDETSDVVSSITVESTEILNRFPVRGKVAIVAENSANFLYGYYELDDPDFPPTTLIPIPAVDSSGLTYPVTVTTAASVTLGSVVTGQQLSIGANLPDNGGGDPVVLTITLTPTDTNIDASTIIFTGPTTGLSSLLERHPIGADGVLTASVTELTSFVFGTIQ